MVEGYLELLTKPQRVALGLAGDALGALDRTVRAGTAAPEEIARQMTGLLDAVGGLAAATAQPLQDFVVRQRELADTVANLAQAQADLAELFASLAQRQAEVAAALERVSAPALGLMGATEAGVGDAKAEAKPRKPAPRSAPKAAQKSAPKSAPKKTAKQAPSTARKSTGKGSKKSTKEA